MATAQKTRDVFNTSSQGALEEKDLNHDITGRVSEESASHSEKLSKGKAAMVEKEEQSLVRMLPPRIIKNENSKVVLDSYRTN